MHSNVIATWLGHTDSIDLFLKLLNTGKAYTKTQMMHVDFQNDGIILKGETCENALCK